ncbi:GNAT family N-acetyltransferase [Kribbella albertanoniae]|uniref:GNAT family N-acetyltransferase n=1 Tax=Kribbella albertanoniae TaxID=1266829 RepID=A0A4V2XMQ2_9ACTN|nr:GNAT family N-acetyltransferase [Kribbella albertanoniae]TDC15236.1 GNAT family N-acetyltransferase [Kribbella albertanoniae]
MSMKIMVVVASTRPGRLGPAIGEWFVRATAATAAELEVVIDVADLAEVGLPFLDEPEHPSTGVYVHAHTRAWSSRVDAADAFVFVTAEYNFAMPATLKNAFDFLSREWAWKPCLFVGYGNTSAGSRAVQMARGVAASMRMLSVGGDVYLRIADDVVDGEVVVDERRAGQARGALTQLVRAADVLRPLRERDGQIVAAAAGDVSELVVLQRACWVDEAIANRAFDLPALTETAAQVEVSLAEWQVWVIRSGGRLIASVRARRDGDAWLIGRLMVAPDYRHQGLGQQLLAHAEAHAPAGTATIALCTGVRSTGPQALYRQAGYSLTREGAPPGSVLLRKAATAGSVGNS